MRTLTRLIAPAALAGVLALAASAPLLALDATPFTEAAVPAAQEAEAGRDVVPPLIWSIVGVLLFCGALGVLYLLKRELGGFELKPGAWTAPISVIASRTLPEDDSDYPASEDDDHGH
ncbi:MAG: hypothetical protein OXE43_08500 [Chloroflexi bacterium]|nr:hypothetical protein [Chloroflexota bacterium]